MILFRVSKWVPMGIFLIILCLKYITLMSMPCTGELSGDEYDYVPKARQLWEDKSFGSVATHEGSLGSWSDFRPVGYSLSVAPLCASSPENKQLKYNVRIVNLCIDLMMTVVLYGIACQFSMSLFYRVCVAFILGAQPWTTSYASCILPDTVTGFLIFFGLVLMAFAARNSFPKKRWISFISSTFLLCSTVVLRPEMSLLSVVLILSGIAAMKPNFRTFLLFGAASSIIYLSFLSFNIAYRHCRYGEWRVYGRLDQPAPGINAWLKTVYLPDAVRQKIYFGSYKGVIFPSEVSSISFSTDSQRDAIWDAFRQIEHDGNISQEVDDFFQSVGESNISENPIYCFGVLRAIKCIQLWVNFETSTSQLWLQSLLPRGVSQMMTGGLFLARIVWLGFSFIGVVRLFHLGVKKWERPHMIMFFGLIFTVLRTLLFGFIYVNGEVRYMVPAWPYVLLLSVYGLSGSLCLIDNWWHKFREREGLV